MAGAATVIMALLVSSPTPAAALVGELPAPTLNSVTVSGTSVTITWTDNSTNEDAFLVYGNQPGQVITLNAADIPTANKAGTGGQMSFTDTITAGTNKCYIIGNYDGAGVYESHYSNQVCITPVGMPLPATPPAIDSGLISTIDTNNGRYTSAVIGTDGLPLVSFLHFPNNGGGAVAVAHCADIACSSASVTDLDVSPSGTNTGWNTSLKIGSDGLGVISYIQGINGGSVLKVAHCSNVACSAATLKTVASNVFFSTTHGLTSLAIGRNTFPEITYASVVGSSGAEVKTVVCNDLLCSSSTSFTLGPLNNPKFSVSSATDSAGNRIAVKVDTAGNLVAISAANGVIDSSGTATDPSVVFGHDGLELITYANSSGLVIAHCSNIFCNGVTKTIADVGVLGDFSTSSVTVGGDGLGVISYYDRAHKNLKVAHCTNLACTSVTTTIVDEFDDQGDDSSITIGTDGLPIISYFDRTNLDLKVVHCPNVKCDGDIVAPF